MRIFKILCILIMLNINLISACYAISYKPYNGFEGYQEITLSDDSYYVAFHGRKDPDDVKLAWKVRSAELCSIKNFNYYVELKYPFEPITKEEIKKQISFNDYDGTFVYARFMYIPIYTPAPAQRSVELISPSKMAAIRCFVSIESLEDSDRAISVKERLHEAKSKGIIN